MSSNLPPGVTDAMIEAQIGEEVEAEATCPRGHKTVHGGYPEIRSFKVPAGWQRLLVDDVDPPEGAGQIWGVDDTDERPRNVHVLGYMLTCYERLTRDEAGRITYCEKEWWVAAPPAEQEKWRAAISAERAADAAMERAQLDDHHANTCPSATEDNAGDDPAWPGVLFHLWGTVCGRWEGPGGVQAYLTESGYTPGYAGNPNAIINGLEIDREAAATVPCPACRQTGAEFESWANQEGGYGVGVAICQCGHATTF